LIFPISSASGEYTSPVNALFTATSAVCVTGLIVVDTGTYWSTFGQGVLFALIQIGGIGFIVGATLLLFAIGGKFGLRDRLVISETIGVDQIGGVLGLVWKVAAFASILEVIGMLIFYFRWNALGDVSTSWWTAIFHATSSFNNCGMDLFGGYKSLTGQGDFVILLVTALLCVAGSTGFIVFADFFRKLSFRKMTLDSKIVLIFSAVLIAAGTIFYLIAEYNNQNTLGLLPFHQKLLLAFSQSITSRTAGFSAMDAGGWLQISLVFTMFLMFIGGATGSVAGGIKVNTFGVLILTVISVFRGKNTVSAFGRQIAHTTIYRSLTIVIFYLLAVGFILVILSITDVFPVEKMIFEVFSALGTVGLSTGITTDLSSAGKYILIAAMFIGRLGPLSLIAYLVHHRQAVDLEYPHESIRLG
jgi:trk system potassium uptake protein TrkH